MVKEDIFNMRDFTCKSCFLCSSYSGGNLYKQRKKRRRKLSERISESLEAKRVCESPSEPAGDSDPSTSGPEDDIVPIHLSDAIKRHLELDYRLVTQENKVGLGLSYIGLS